MTGVHTCCLSFVTQPLMMTTKQHILVVEDDKNISKLVKYNLEKEGYLCTAVITGEEALDFLDSHAVDLVLLDIMLPKIDGFETWGKEAV